MYYTEHYEFVYILNDGYKGWIDPVWTVEETDESITIDTGHYKYPFEKKDIRKWTIRPYNPDTTYNEF